MTPLIEAIKNWRKVKEERNGLRFTSAEWAFNPLFIGEPINSNTVRAIGDYVDDKLTEYSLQNNLNPIRNRLQGILRGNTCETDITDDHVASEGEEENYPRDDDPSLDMVAYTSGQEYRVRNRIKDSFVRRHPQEQQMGISSPPFPSLRETYNITNPERVAHNGHNIEKVIRFCPPPAAPQIDSAYITSYNIDYRENKVKARIIIAPKDKIINHSDWFYLCTNSEPSTIKDVIKKTIWENMSFGIVCRQDPFTEKIYNNASEWRALESLREMITEDAYKKYIKQGFLLVSGFSGLVYQIYRNKWHIKVWDKGNIIEEICVRINSGVPPSDNVIAFKTIVETNEEELRKMGNVYNMRKAA